MFVLLVNDNTKLMLCEGFVYLRFIFVTFRLVELGNLNSCYFM